MHAGLDRQAGTGTEGTHAGWSPWHYAHCLCTTGAGIHALRAGDKPAELHGKTTCVANSHGRADGCAALACISDLQLHPYAIGPPPLPLQVPKSRQEGWANHSIAPFAM